MNQKYSKWTKSQISSLVNNCSDVNDFKKKFPKAYATAHHYKWMNEFYPHPSYNISDVASTYKSFKEFRTKNPSAYNKAHRLGLIQDIKHMLIEKETGFSKDEVVQLSTSYEKYSQFVSSDIARAATKYGIFEEVTKHMTKRTKWTKEKLHEIALKYANRIDFQKDDVNAYQAAYRLGMLDMICSHMNENLMKWDKSKIHEVALRCSTRGEFIERYPSTYQAAHIRGIVDDVCSHMDVIRKKWSNSELFDESKKYKTRSEFCEKCGAAYHYANRRGMLDDICAHMEPSKYGTDNNMIYIWEALGINSERRIFKIGITSKKSGTKRIDEVARKKTLTPHIIILREVVGKATDIERHILDNYGESVNWDESFDGSTEFRYLSENDLTNIISWLSSHQLVSL